MDAHDVVRELVADLRKHEASARELLAKVPTDADETNVRSHVRLRTKAAIYEHAASLVEDALERVPKPRNEWRAFGDMLLGVSAYLSKNHELDHISFSAGGETVYVYVRGATHTALPIELDLNRVDEIGANETIRRAINLWKKR